MNTLLQMSQLERAARRAWLANAARSQFGKCDSCGRSRDDNDKPLFVARQPHRSDYECLECWDGRQ